MSSSPVPHNTLSNIRSYGIMSSLVLSQLVQMIPYGVGINSGITIASHFGASEFESAWIAASYPYVKHPFSCFVIIVDFLMGIVQDDPRRLRPDRRSIG